jgi:hypothetical protein
MWEIMQSEKDRALDSELKSVMAIFGYAAVIGTPIAYLDGILTMIQFSLLEIFFIFGFIIVTNLLFRRWEIEELKTNKLYRAAGTLMLFVCIPIATIFDLLMSVIFFSHIFHLKEPLIIAGNIEIISMAMNLFIIMGFLIAIAIAWAFILKKRSQ